MIPDGVRLLTTCHWPGDELECPNLGRRFVSLNTRKNVLRISLFVHPTNFHL
jgi:hypothetical protein